MGASSIISKRHALDATLEGSYKSKIQDSVQLQTVLALYDQETVRNNNGQTSYSRLKTSGRHHIDQMMKTRNLMVRNEVVERRSVTKSQKGKKAYVERINQDFEIQRLQLQQANHWADQAQGEKISLHGESEVRNRLFRENHARDCQEIEELRRICCEETDRARQREMMNCPCIKRGILPL